MFVRSARGSESDAASLAAVDGWDLPGQKQQEEQLCVQTLPSRPSAESASQASLPRPVQAQTGQASGMYVNPNNLNNPGNLSIYMYILEGLFYNYYI